MFTILDAIPAWVQMVILVVGLIILCIIALVKPLGLPKLTLTSFALIYTGAIFAVTHRLLVNANYSSHLIRIFHALYAVSGISGFILLMIQGYRTIFKYNEKQKKIFWIYIIGMISFGTFMFVWIKFF